MINQILKRIGLKNVKKHDTNSYNDVDYPDFDSMHLDIIRNIKDYTMTSPERIFALIEAVKYIVNNNISGEIVECGVWKGGSLMAIMQVLMGMKINDRKIIGFDTFEQGMTESKTFDVSVHGLKGKDVVKEWEKNNDYPSQKVVTNYLLDSGYNKENIKLVKGDIIDTLKKESLGNIALLRLDTDWYETTKFELEYLYDKVVKGGIIIIDDYGYWKGARKAVDEFISQSNLPVYLARIDSTARLIVKT
jgi:O-methyltransferase